jgi:uncharacterized protein (DUF58 family)
MRPTPKAALLFSMSVPLALLIVSVWSVTWYISLYLPIIVLTFLVVDAFEILPVKHLLVVSRVPKYLYIGQSGFVELDLSVKNHSRLLCIKVLLELTGDAELSGERIDSSTIIDGQLSLSLKIVPHRRGQAKVDALWLRWRSPLGLVEITQRRSIESVIDVVPDVKGIHEAALQFFSRDAVYGVKTQRLRGDGTEFENLTEYASGMDSRKIDWKRSASHRKLLCKEFKQERNHQIVLGFDTGRLMLEPVDDIPKLDHAVKAALLLSWISLRNGDFVGGCCFDSRFRSLIKPGRRMPYFMQMQRFTAALAYRTEETNFTLGLSELNSRLNRRTLVVLFTDFVDSISAELLIESLQIMTKRHVVVFVTLRDPLLASLQSAPPNDFHSAAEAVIADDFLRERSIVLERIARLGIHCLDVSVKAVSSALVNRYLMIKQRGLL